MSSSISFGTSLDLDTLTSKSITRDPLVAQQKELPGSGSKYHNLSRNYDNKACKGNDEVKSGAKTYSKLHKLHQHYDEGPHELDSENFYQEVDHRMSRNSVEYPEEQAKYVDKWLSDMDFSKSFSFDSMSQNGNVIGIRGYPEKSPSSKDIHEYRARYNKLKFNFSKLQTDYEKLRSQLGSTEVRFKRALDKRDHDIDVLREFIKKRVKKSSHPDEQQHRCCCCGHSPNKSPQRPKLGEQTEQEQLAKLRQDFKLQALRLNALEREHEIELNSVLDEKERLKNQYEQVKINSDKELISLRNQVQALSLEPSNKLIISMRNENSRLKDSDEVRRVEFLALKENYKQMESELRSIHNEQGALNSDKNEELSRMMVELCRLQVYQPKLEATLEVERAIKSELQNRIERLSAENDNLKNQINDQRMELNKEISRSKRLEASEVHSIQQELAQWQEKYYRLKREKSDADELLLVNRSKISSLDSKHRAEIDLVKESSQNEINKLVDQIDNLEEACKDLKSKLGLSELKLNEYASTNGRLTDEVMELNKRLTKMTTTCGVDDIETLRKKLKDAEGVQATLRDHLEISESRNREMLLELERLRAQVERGSQQVEQFRERFKNQQKSLEELKDKRDKELARLRVSLNFERYNRQVALKGIEKELRCSLAELEAMKYRFSRRLAQSEPIDESINRALSSIHSNGFPRSSATTTSSATCMNQPQQQDQAEQEREVH